MIKDIALEVAELVEKKNRDYGNSFDKTLNEYGDTAYFLRIEDKISRLKSLTKKDAEVDESIEDTLKDIIGYTDRRVSRAVVWKCKCACGNITYMTHRCLKSSVSCGCYQKENCSKLGLIYNSVGREAYKNKLNKGKVKL